MATVDCPSGQTSLTTTSCSHQPPAFVSLPASAKVPTPEEDEGGGGESSERKRGRRRPTKVQQLVLCTSKCRYNVIKKAAKQLGYKLSDDENGEWDVYWNDTQGVLPD